MDLPLLEIVRAALKEREAGNVDRAAYRQQMIEREQDGHAAAGRIAADLIALTREILAAGNEDFAALELDEAGGDKCAVREVQLGPATPAKIVRHRRHNPPRRLQLGTRQIDVAVKGRQKQIKPAADLPLKTGG